MKNITVGYIISKVQVLLNEHKSSTLPIEGELSTGTLDLDHYIVRVLREALTLCYKFAPSDLLQVSYPDTEHPILPYRDDSTPLPRYYYAENSEERKRYLCLELPDSFSELVRFKMKAWAKGVGELQLPESSLFAEQYNEYTEAGRNTPKANLVYSPRGKKCIECHPNGIPKGWQEGDPFPLDYLVFTPLPNQLPESMNDLQVEPQDKLLFPEMNSILFDAWCYMTASLVYRIFEDMPSSQAMEQVAIALLQKREELQQPPKKQ